MSSPKTQAARRIRVAELLSAQSIHSQEELRSLLAEEGFAVTQATLSRDLVDLGAIKLADGDGRHVYALGSTRGDEPGVDTQRTARAFHDLVVSVDHSANIVVVRTPPGGAQYLASTIDRAQWEAVIGTVAGDDTVFLVTRDPRGGATVAAHVLDLAQSRAGDPRASGRKGHVAKGGRP